MRFLLKYNIFQRWILLSVICWIPILGFGQKGNKKLCGSTTQVQEENMKKNASYFNHVNNWKSNLKNLAFKKAPNCANGPIIIPVAIHFEAGVVPASNEACAIGLVVEQINILNQEMNGIDPDNETHSNFQGCLSPIGSACLKFCIASQNHPNGYGLNDGALAITFGKVNFNNLIPGSSIPLDANWAGYVNIFVGNLDNGIIGQSPIPGDVDNAWGLIVSACSFGSGNFKCNGFNNSTTCGGLLDEGETLTHEMGHYLGLYHIWGDGGCDQDDNIGDTPNMDSSYEDFTGCGGHSSCNDLPSSCGSSDMYMNYMSYVADQCMYMFTSEQADKMYQTAEFLGFDTNVPSVCGENTEICTGSNYLYSITNVNSGLVLEVNGASADAGANVQQGNNNGTVAQQWYFEEAGNDLFSITNVNSGLVLDINAGSPTAGANLQQWNNNGTVAQQWSLQDIGNGQYFITNANSGIVLDVDGGSTEAGANIQQWDINGTGAQLWLLNLVSGNCNSNDDCASQGGDSDNDGVCDNQDTCPNLDDNLIGTGCNDNDPNTENDIWQSNCNCEGTPIASNDKIQAKVFLEGFFNGTNGLTKNTDHATLMPNNQPFNTAPWNYNGNESATNIPTNAVDWILLVTRDVNGNIQEQKAGFISTSGEIMDTDGTLGISLNNAYTYFSIHHKSHLAVMSSSAYTSGIYDFTTNVNQAMGTAQMAQQGGKYMMYSGDYDCNGIINNVDYNNWKTNSATLNQYLNVDGDGNGIINNLDYNLWTKNRSKIGHPPLQY